MKALTDYKVLTFDTYGTLIDWESGIYNALAPLLAKLQMAPERDSVLERFAQMESDQQSATPAMVYSDLLQVVYRRLSEDWDVVVDDDEVSRFGRSVKDWPAFEDSADALRYLKGRYKLVTLTNCDRESYRGSNARFEIEWDAIYTAQDVGSYKPDHRNFEYMLQHLQKDFGLGKADILHTAQSLFHDHVPATHFGLATNWIDRRHSQSGYGATMPPPAEARIDFRFDSMADFVAAHIKAVGATT